MQTVQTAQNPQLMLQQMMTQNPQLQNVATMLQNSGSSPEQFARALAQQKGININNLISWLTRG